MTIREAAEQALEALQYIYTETTPEEDKYIDAAIASLCAALSQTPLKREWVGLTDEEVEDVFPHAAFPWFFETVRAIETKLKEKNT